ncbi:hypothetical protein BIW11_04133 [Tropilaelaps mercedesae]|uniref:Uncharacterized protein n=1 Tax=Tropilaelaps mercedesae TaxID=418985 RepID=A0A1V9XAJ0_9ACAR|nr:hypothetical protein BIW11_04133 [Tropilaelaps mercedesae]
MPSLIAPITSHAAKFPWPICSSVNNTERLLATLHTQTQPVIGALLIVT